MSRATVPKLTKMQTDIEKMNEKLIKMRADLTAMTVNPRGSDVELVKLLRTARDSMIEGSSAIREAHAHLDEPIAILTRRKPKKA